MPDQHIPDIRDDKAKKQKYWGLGLLVVAVCLQVPYFWANRAPEPCRFPSPQDDHFIQFIIVGIGIGLIGLAYLGRGAGLYRASLTSLVTVVVIAEVLLVIAIPNFLHYSEKSPQAEAKSILGGIYVAEKAFYEERKRFGTLEEIGFTLPGSNRYTYRIDSSGSPGTIIPPRRGGRRETHQGLVETPLTICDPSPDNTVVRAAYSSTGFTATATGNIDNDMIRDQWHINDAKHLLVDVDDKLH